MKKKGPPLGFCLVTRVPSLPLRSTGFFRANCRFEFRMKQNRPTLLDPAGSMTQRCWVLVASGPTVAGTCWQLGPNTVGSCCSTSPSIVGSCWSTRATIIGSGGRARPNKLGSGSTRANVTGQQSPISLGHAWQKDSPAFGLAGQ